MHTWNAPPEGRILPDPPLEKTRQTWHKSEDGLSEIFNTPVETGRTLIAEQGHIEDYQGTCGIVSCANILRLAGDGTACEENLLAFAKAYNLCAKNTAPSANGGTNFMERRVILDVFGVSSSHVHLEPMAAFFFDAAITPRADNPENMARRAQTLAGYVSEGRGVILSVYAAHLWKDPRFGNLTHAITVTSVKRGLDGTVEGFYVCDSGPCSDHYARYYPADHLIGALTYSQINVTDGPIR